MVLLYFTVNRKTLQGISSEREFVEHLQRVILSNIDKKQVKGIDINDTMRDLVTDNLDSLFKISDDLARDEVEIEQFLKALEKKISELSPGKELIINLKGDNKLQADKAVFMFQWDENKYPKNHKTISEIMNKIKEKYDDSQKTIKSKTDEYLRLVTEKKTKEKDKLDALNLMKQDYRTLINECKKEMIETDYLCTMLCFVQTGNEKNFLENYEKLADNMVLPSSAKRLDKGEDEKIQLYRVVVMKHKKDDFKTGCSKLKVNCREYNKEDISNKSKEEREISELQSSLKIAKTTLINNCSSSYSEVYYALLHLKYLRLYVESSLKFSAGEYYSVIVSVPKEREQKLVLNMIKNFDDTKEKGLYGTKEELKESEDCYPFILIKLNVPSNI